MRNPTKLPLPNLRARSRQEGSTCQGPEAGDTWCPWNEGAALAWAERGRGLHTHYPSTWVLVPKYHVTHPTSRRSLPICHHVSYPLLPILSKRAPPRTGHPSPTHLSAGSPGSRAGCLLRSWSCLVPVTAASAPSGQGLCHYRSLSPGNSGWHVVGARIFVGCVGDQSHTRNPQALHKLLHLKGPGTRVVPGERAGLRSLPPHTSWAAWPL